MTVSPTARRRAWCRDRARPMPCRREPRCPRLGGSAPRHHQRGGLPRRASAHGRVPRRLSVVLLFVGEAASQRLPRCPAAEQPGRRCPKDGGPDQLHIGLACADGQGACARSLAAAGCRHVPGRLQHGCDRRARLAIPALHACWGRSWGRSWSWSWSWSQHGERRGDGVSRAAKRLNVRAVRR